MRPDSQLRLIKINIEKFSDYLLINLNKTSISKTTNKAREINPKIAAAKPKKDIYNSFCDIK